jgi:hypothetical protein
VKRHIVAAVLAMLCSLVVVGTAAGWDKPAPPPAPPISQIEQQDQGNASDQQQVQVLPIAPQLNVQNVNVLTSGDVQQGDANDANTGQANQQEGTQVAVQQGGGESKGSPCGSCSQAQPEPSGSADQSVDQHQGNESDQKQVQVVPIAPQANVQNVNAGTGGNVSQGDANNANTGQANQQENTQVAVQSGGGPGGGQSQTTDQAQGNTSSQGQAQIVPIAPQANVQNVNVLTSGDVRQGDANNANTGQANQQQNTQVAVQKGSGGPSHDGCDCNPKGPRPGSGDPAANQHQGNWSKQKQVEVVPVAPQLNVQNVNVGTSDVRQGDANNANTGQASQQHNTQVAVQRGVPAPDHGPTSPSWSSKPKGHGPTSHGGSSIRQSQGNWSSQKQLQVVPIAPQANVQNENLLTFGKVSQGDANNANTGQANQQHNTQVAVQEAGHPSHPAPGRAGCKPGGKCQGGCKPDGKCQDGCKPDGKCQDGCKPDRKCQDGCKPAGKPGPPKPGTRRIEQHQGNWSSQKQLQLIPIAPQLNLQNVNLLTFGSVRQGDVNNANTGQASQQQNTQIAWQQERLPHGGMPPA